MKTANISKFILTCLMATGAVVYSASISQAAPAQVTLTAPVELVSPVSIDSATAINFGQIVPPTGPAADAYTVNSDGTTATLAGGSGEFVPGTASAGAVDVTGPTGTNVELSSNINTTPLICTKLEPATGDVTLTAIRFFNNSVLTRTMNDSPQTIPMGGTVKVPPGATGSHECTYIVDAIFVEGE